jgi:hypothetical protein
VLNCPDIPIAIGIGSVICHLGFIFCKFINEKGCYILAFFTGPVQRNCAETNQYATGNFQFDRFTSTCQRSTPGGIGIATKDTSQALVLLRNAANYFKKHNLALEEGKCHMAIGDIFEAGQYSRSFGNYIIAQDLFYEVSQRDLFYATLGVAKSQYYVACIGLPPRHLLM